MKKPIQKFESAPRIVGYERPGVEMLAEALRAALAVMVREEIRRQTIALPTPEQMRLERGWDAEDLANRAGVSVPTLRRIELGTCRRLQAKTIERLARALGRPDYAAAAVRARKVGQ